LADDFVMESQVSSTPSLSTVREAAVRLAGIAHRTPVLTSRTLNELVGAEVWLKPENFQRAGAFKFRGAYNAVSRLSPDETRRGVVTYSSGNHAQALALAGKLLGAPVTVVMPSDAPAAKLAATRGYGAEVVLYDPRHDSRSEIARRLGEERGLTLIPPFDHPHVISGAGTAALELLEDTGGLDLLFVPCGGGGLLSGSALAATSHPECGVIGVEPELADDAARSFRSGLIQKVRNPPTIADGLRTPSLGELTWPIIRDHVSDFTTVTEDGIVEAMRLLWTRLKLVVEPSGAVGIAGLLANRGLVAGKRVGVLLSGGNVDLANALALHVDRDETLADDDAA
jgi:threonine dehydratase